jgi:hypothetical protein
MRRASVPALARRSSFLGAFVAAICLTLAGCHAPASAQAPLPAPAPPPAAVQAPASAAAARAVQHPASAASATGRAPARNASAAKANGRQVTKPLWRDLPAAQQQSLAPLAATWDAMSEAQKRKWLALSHNFPKMSGDEQAKLHSRMTEWAALSPQQRTQARLNFGVTRQLSPDDKKAKWEAYQALPPEEKRKLAASAAKPPATAAAVKPVPMDKLATIPKPKPVSPAPRITLPTGNVNNSTLLPQRPPASAPAPAAVPASAPARAG